MPLARLRERPEIGRALAAVALALLQACRGAPPLLLPEPTPPLGPLLARDQNYAVVLVQPDENLAALAERYLGDARKSWWIADFNDITEVRPGQDVVIPLKAPKAPGVHPHGFQTVTVLCYHRLGANRSKLSVTPEAFEAQMDYLAQQGYRVIALSAFAEFLAGSDPLPRRSVVITFDDGYASTFEIAYPILRKHNFPATVFVYSDFIGLPDALSWAQLQDMTRSGLIEIQPHSKTHSNLALRTPKESEAQYRERLRQEVEAPIGAIRSRLGATVHSYAYPYGDANDTVTELMARNGIRLGFTVTPGGNPFFAYPLMLRRTMVFGEDDLAAFKSKLAVYTKMNAR